LVSGRNPSTNCRATTPNRIKVLAQITIVLDAADPGPDAMNPKTPPTNSTPIIAQTRFAGFGRNALRSGAGTSLLATGHPAR
jgi:hypothetical protein